MRIMGMLMICYSISKYMVFDLARKLAKVARDVGKPKATHFRPKEEWDHEDATDS